MQTSLWAIAKKSAKVKSHRFGNLFRLLNNESLLWCWSFLNKKAAPGIDRVTANEYAQNLHVNIATLAAKVKTKRYHAKLVRRQYIPKSNGKLRPLGIPATDDKVLQMAVAKILEAIYEQDFLGCSFGYRPKLGPMAAVKLLDQQLYTGRFYYIVEADIQDFFGTLDHDQLLNMLQLRLADAAFLGLIAKWLKAGIMDTDGKILSPAAGTPQGSIVSPVLSNIYLHHVLDCWFYQTIVPRCRGAALLCRYADDFVCAFQCKEDAQRFYQELGNRLTAFGLKLAPDKTRLLSFSRYQQRSSSFVFLGFEFYWGKSRHGRPQLFRRTASKKLHNSIANFTTWVKENRHLQLRELFTILNSKLRGYYNYYGVRGNYQRLNLFFYLAVNILFKWLNRRSQRKSFTWATFQVILNYYKIQRPRIVEKVVHPVPL